MYKRSQSLSPRTLFDITLFHFLIELGSWTFPTEERRSTTLISIPLPCLVASLTNNNGRLRTNEVDTAPAHRARPDSRISRGWHRNGFCYPEERRGEAGHLSLWPRRVPGCLAQCSVPLPCCLRVPRCFQANHSARD